MRFCLEQSQKEIVRDIGLALVNKESLEYRKQMTDGIFEKQNRVTNKQVFKEGIKELIDKKLRSIIENIKEIRLKLDHIENIVLN